MQTCQDNPGSNILDSQLIQATYMKNTKKIYITSPLS